MCFERRGQQSRRISHAGRAVECVLPVNFAEGATTPWRLMCWTPNDGFTVEMSYNGRVRRTTLKGVGMTPQYVRQSARQSLLNFGRDWAWFFDRNGFGTLWYTCSSRSNGLTCTNRAGHGWWLGRFKGYRIF